MPNWMTTLLQRRAGMVPGYVGDDESHEDFAERMRVSEIPPPPGAAPTAPTPAGWHPDPWKAHEVRFFDGVDWTEHVADNGEASTDPVPAGESAAAK